MTIPMVASSESSDAFFQLMDIIGACLGHNSLVEPAFTKEMNNGILHTAYAKNLTPYYYYYFYYFGRIAAESNSDMHNPLVSIAVCYQFRKMQALHRIEEFNLEGIPS